MSSWSNFKRLITPGKVQRSSKFSPFLDVSELCHLGVSLHQSAVCCIEIILVYFTLSDRFCLSDFFG